MPKITPQQRARGKPPPPSPPPTPTSLPTSPMSDGESSSSSSCSHGFSAALECLANPEAQWAPFIARSDTKAKEPLKYTFTPEVLGFRTAGALGTHTEAPKGFKPRFGAPRRVKTVPQKTKQAEDSSDEFADIFAILSSTESEGDEEERPAAEQTTEPKSSGFVHDTPPRDAASSDNEEATNTPDTPLPAVEAKPFIATVAPLAKRKKAPPPKPASKPATKVATKKATKPTAKGGAPKAAPKRDTKPKPKKTPPPKDVQANVKDTPTEVNGGQVSELTSKETDAKEKPKVTKAAKEAPKPRKKPAPKETRKRKAPEGGEEPKKKARKNAPCPKVAPKVLQKHRLCVYRDYAAELQGFPAKNDLFKADVAVLRALERDSDTLLQRLKTYAQRATYIEGLHAMNDAKDDAELLIGKIAENKGQPLAEVRAQFTTM